MHNVRPGTYLGTYMLHNVRPGTYMGTYMLDYVLLLNKDQR